MYPTFAVVFVIFSLAKKNTKLGFLYIVGSAKNCRYKTKKDINLALKYHVFCVKIDYTSTITRHDNDNVFYAWYKPLGISLVVVDSF